MVEKKKEKVKRLNEECMVLSIICEKLEKINQIKEDPRLVHNKDHLIHQTAFQILESLIETI